MEGRFHSTPAKRPFDMPDTISAFANGSSKRRPKAPPPPIVVSHSDAAFRLLCPSSKIGGLIGKSGAVVNQLRQETGAKIRVEDAVPDCDERAVLIVGPHSSTKKIALKPGEEREVSPAQEALLRVFDRALEVDAEAEGGAAAPGNVSCRLLVPGGQVGCVMGKGGKVIERIRKESGAKIRVLPGEQLPLCALPSDEVVQIMGDALAVKKALLAVSKCLQENPSSDKAQVVGSKTVGTGLHGSIPDTRGSFPDPRGDHFLHRNSFLSPTRGSSLDYVERGHQLPTAVRKISMLDQKNTHEEVAFRLLCPNDKVGGVIGKGGSIINALENETGASISVGSTLPDSEERLITVTAMENPESRYSAAQNAIARVFTRSIEAGYEKGLDSGSGKGAPVAARLLVASNQIGCLMGKGGTIIADMRKATGANIRILGGDQVPKCASENDEVVQVSSGSKSALVTNTTVDIMVPEHVMGAVYGENGSNLGRIRQHNYLFSHFELSWWLHQISGAKVIVHDPRPGAREGMVVISGTPDQTQAAQSLLQAFIISAPSSDSHSRLL
ncbi:KH domain-containing protein HEN4-like protein isoform X1 [Cinnamomum micranthum f. kanehirae]|uniref:KH domain-containing protein HEN4-like protein isoform X1 n=1 Tax=Cinnamomum micranthum f. kanehirae TaxID=337451 RepID=A0A3S3M6J0_9MAGN|nr:KH domain-containing protein HEN4-like protein isoform X1 [Cinnamomum micranthum f. kanehirae]